MRAFQFVHTDDLNTPRLVADAAGTTVWRWDQAEPFGNNPADEDPDANSVAFDLPLRLPGQYLDKETNLAYNYYRDYDPAIGRYVQADPIGLRGGLNTYLYVNGSPLSYVDPTGEVGKVVAGCVLLASTVYFVYKYRKWIKCIETCTMCQSDPNGNQNKMCPPSSALDSGSTGPTMSCRTLCTLGDFAGSRGKGAEGSREAPGMHF